MVMGTFRYLALFILLTFSCYGRIAQAKQVTACYEGTCFPSLSAAEAAMKADPMYGALLTRKSSRIATITGNSVVTAIVYEVSNREPERLYKPGFMMAGWAVDPSGCAPSESNAVLCADEGAIYSYFTNRFLAPLRRSNCSISNERLSGGYAEPFSESYSHHNGRSGNYGTLSFQQVAQKSWEFEVNCPGWGRVEYDKRSYPLYKQQAYKCPVGFYSRSGKASGFAPAGTDPSAVIEWPQLCRPEVTFKEIRVTTTQVASCATAHPCHPTTGDKSRAETDFVFAGRPFVRSYHSLHQLSGNSGSAPGWSHTYEERLEMYGRKPTLFDGDGNFETFERMSDGRYRAKNSPDRILLQVEGGGWRLRDGRGGEKAFDRSGQLLSIKDGSDPSGDAFLSYSNRLLDKVADLQGRSLKFSYIGRRLAGVSLPSGAVIQYRYDLDGNLAEVDYGGGMVRKYHYHEAGLALPRQTHLLTGITTEDGQRCASFAYDDSDRVISSSLSGETGPVERTTLVYRSDTSVDVTTDGRGTRTIEIQPGIYRRPLSIVDSKGTSTNTFRPDGRLAARVDPRGTRTEFEYSGTYRSATIEAVGMQSERRTATVRDSMNREARRETWSKKSGVQVLERIDLHAYDAQGRVTALCTVDPLQSEASNYVCGSSTQPPAGVRQTLRRYCGSGEIQSGACPAEGMLVSVKGSRLDANDIASFQYYLQDHADCESSPTTCSWRKGDLRKVVNALGQVTETLRYDGAGRVLSVKDANGVITDLEYHPRGWLTASKVRGTNSSSEADDLINRIDYYPTGLVSNTTLPDGSFTSYVYDAARRLTDIVDADGNRIHYTLDNAGNRIKDEVRGSGDSLKRTLSRVYNQLGQLQAVKDAGNHPTGFTYDANGNLDTTMDALGRVTDSDHDPLGHLSRTLQDVGGINAETRFRYDALDNLTEVVDPKGLSTRYSYSAFGDLTKLESPDTGITTFGYDSAGNRTSALDARGELASYGYDALNRLISIGYSDTSLNVTYIYDAVQVECTATESFAVGHLTRMNDGSGSTSYCYDRFGNLTRKVQVTNGQALTLRYAYTKAGQLSGMEYPDGTVVDYVRDGLGRATEVGVALPGNPRQVLLTGATYHPFGPIAGWTFGNGRTMVRTLDLDYRPKAILSTGTGAGGLNLGYGWDAVGNMASLHTSGLEQPPKVKFGYDALNRLTEFQDGPTGVAIEKYTYDATGNRTSFTNANGAEFYAYPADSHRLAAVGGAPRSYDAMGNTMSIGGTAREFSYNAAGRISGVERDNAVMMIYAYNGKGEQVRKHFATSSTYTEYDESGHWVGDYDTNGGLAQQVIWLDDLPIGLISNAQISYIEPDHLGTPRAVIEPQRDVGVWSWHMASEAFGNSAPSQDPDGDTALFELSMRFAGQRYDAAAGMSNNYFRDYDASSGRYAQSDPIGLEGGTSTYGYVASSPTTAFDPLGLQAVRPPRGVSTQGGSNIYTGPVRGLIREIQLYNPSFSYQTIGPRGHSYNQSDYAYLTRVLSQQRYEYQSRYPNSCPAGAGAPPSPYSVAFETAIPKVGAGRRTSHNVAANRALTNEMERDPSFARMMSQLGIEPAQRLDQSPSGWSWHHTSGRPGVMQLVPRSQHESSPYRPALHPNNGRGGYSEWGADY